MDAPRLRLSRYAAPGGCCHVARSRIVTSLDRVHRHDFHELFWIEAGAGEQVVDGVRAPLGAGDLVLVRPEDAHGFAPAPGGLVMVNLALASAVAEEAVRRWCPGGGPWAGSPAQRRHRLAPAALRRLAAGADRLAGAWGRPDERRALDRLLLDLFDALDAEPAGDAAPPWLRQAVASLATDRQRLALGAAALAGACRRSPAHVARCVRAAYGTTPTVLVDRLRLERAAEDLRMTAHPIARIALDAGYLTLGYFYRRFQARFRCTPRAYRRLHAEPLGG